MDTKGVWAGDWRYSEVGHHSSTDLILDTDALTV